MAGLEVSNEYVDEIALLESMFGGTISAAVIASVIESYDGNVHLAADAIMNFSNEMSIPSADVNESIDIRPVQTTNNNIDVRPMEPATALNADAPCFEYGPQQMSRLPLNSGHQQSQINKIQLRPSNARHTLPTTPNYQIPATVMQQLPSMSNSGASMFSRQLPSTSAYQPILNQQPSLATGLLPSAEPPTFSFSEAFRNSGALPKKPPDSKPQKPAYTKKNVWMDGDQVGKIQHYYNQGARILVIMRGASGSGKTYLAKHIVDYTVGPSPQNHFSHIFSTDDYFMRRGIYQFNRDCLEEAHSTNQRRVCEATNNGVSPIIVDNTNTELWEMEPYIRDAVRNGYMIEFVEPNTPWFRNANQLERRNTHGVPREGIRWMLDRYDRGITPESAMRTLRLTYPRNRKPPVQRNIPPFSPPGSSRESPRKEYIDKHNHKNQPSNQASDSSKVQNPRQDTSASENAPLNVAVSFDDENRISTNSENNEHKIRAERIIEAQKKIEQIEKVEHEWDNGERWEAKSEETGGSCQTLAEYIASSTSDPKPPRQSESKDPEKLIEPNAICDDWTKIAMFMPPWQDSNNISSVTTEELPVQLETRNIGTSYEAGDIDEHGSGSVLYGNPRDINQGLPEKNKFKIPKMIALDKSTSTNENDFLSKKEICKNKEYHFRELRRMFKSVPRQALRDIFESCYFDVNWAVNLVLDGYREYIETSSGPLSDDEDEVEGPIEDCNCLAGYNIVPDVVPIAETPPMSEPQEEPQNVTPQRKTKRENKPLSENSLQLKRQIENNVMIPDNHYSQHYLNLRRRRDIYTNGSDRGASDTNSTNTEGVPQTAVSGLDINENEKDKKPEILALAEAKQSNYPTDFRDVAGPSNAQYHLDFMNAENDSDTESDSNKSDNLEKTVAVNLGQECIDKLDELFGRKDFTYPENIQPVVYLPMSIVEQINAYWAMSVASQMDDGSRQTEAMIKQDEEFARQLAAKEQEMTDEGNVPEIPSLKEIMEMELAYSIYERGIAEWRNSEPQDLAAKMSREKLYNLFPDVAKDVLSEMLMAHGYDFKATVEILIVSTGQADLLKEDKAIEKFVMKKEMERKQKYLEEQQKDLDDADWPDLSGSDHPITLETVDYYRAEAEKSLRCRNANFEKARQYFARNSPEAASFYSEIAALHTRKYEHSSCLAAAYLMNYHVQKNPDNEVLDLHFLRVPEAMVNLDLFLDKIIRKLRTTNLTCKDTWIITGRGKHSPGGPRIKPATKRRLRGREISFKIVNGGLLIAKVHVSHKLTNELAENS